MTRKTDRGDPASLSKEKQNLRHSMLLQRKAVSPGDSRRGGTEIADLIEKDPLYRESDAVMYYLAMPGECSLDELIRRALKQGKHVYIPYCLPGRNMEAGRLLSMDHFEKGPLGLRNLPKDHEILPPQKLDLVLIPALAIGLDGTRLGMGAGYYDRFLKQIPLKKRTAAVWDFQVVPSVPAGPQDLPVSRIFTEKRVISI